VKEFRLREFKAIMQTSRCSDESQGEARPGDKKVAIQR